MEQAPTLSLPLPGGDAPLTAAPSGDAPPFPPPGEASPPPPPGDVPPPPPGGDLPPSGPPPPPPPPGQERHRALRRDTEHRVIGGVAAGLAEYLDIDPVFVRLAFVVLALIGGSGVLLYLAGWLLIPDGSSGHTVAHDWMQRQPRRRSVLGVVLGIVIAIVAVSNLVSSGPWWHWGWNGGFGFFFGLSALALALLLVLSPGRAGSSALRALLVTALVAATALVVVVAATLFTAEAVSGVPLRGGIGDSHWEPTAAAQVHRQYRLAIGNLTVDLRNVVFPAGTTHVTATVGIGHVEVDIPPGPSVSVTAHSGVGHVQVFGQNDSGFSAGQAVSSDGAPGSPDNSARTANSGATAPTGATPNSGGTAATGTLGNASHIVLDVEAGVGQVQVIR